MMVSLSIKSFADLINSQNYGLVTPSDPSLSDVSKSALFNNCTVIKQSDVFFKYRRSKI
jgi:hypothetical protein